MKSWRSRPIVSLLRENWIWLALGAAVFLGRRRIVARIPGTRRHLARRAGASDFMSRLAQRLVATAIPDHRSVRIWIRSDHVGEHSVVLEGPEGTRRVGRFDVPDDPALDGTTVVRIPDDIGGEDLRPITSYRFEVRSADGARIGAGRFTTAPRGEADAPDRFAIAIASCHQPFADDGSIAEKTLRPLAGLAQLFERHRVRALMLLGDQMYNDLPAGQSLFDDLAFRRVAPAKRRRVLDCTREEVRALLQHRYRAFWKVEPFARLQASFPTVCMLDDHELVDNFGSDPEHATQAWAAFREGALDAFHDYQGLRAHDRPRPAAFPTRFAWGPLAGLVLDLRSQRVCDADRIRPMGEDQWALLDRFLLEELARPVLMLGLTVPLLHVPEWMVTRAAKLAPRGSGVHERWSHPAARASRDRLVHRLLAHRRAAPDQRVILVSGDVHVGTVCEVTFDGEHPMLQVVSSALSNLENVIVRKSSSEVAELRPAFETEAGVCCAARLIEGVDGAAANPYKGLNAGIIEIHRARGRWDVRVRLVGEGEDEDAAIVYDTGSDFVARSFDRDARV